MTSGTLRSFITVDRASDFPIQNLPYGIFSPSGLPPRVGVAIGEFVLDLSVLAERGLIGERAAAERYFSDSTLNRFMGLGRSVWKETRARVSELLSANCPTLRDDKELLSHALHPMERITMRMPIEVKGYTDFYSSLDHARNVGAMFRGADNALKPNWRWVPIAYDGRAGSIVLSDTPIQRPLGQTRPSEEEPPRFGPSRALDFELELAFIVGVGTELGSSIPIEKVDDHVFGVVILNDWSARDIQKWEYEPLGPFLGKNFGTSISPWVVTLDALEPFKVVACTQEPPPLEYLRSPREVFDINLEVSVSPKNAEPQVVTRSNSKYLYWDHHQQLAHHTSNGCPMSAGDVFATGTISGPTPESLGCLLELAKGGKAPITLANGEVRSYLLDGDTVTMRGWCEASEYRIGFGVLRNLVVPAPKVRDAKAIGG